MHHKRGRPKSRRAGCQLCKPHKRNGCSHPSKAMRFGDRRRSEGLRDQLRCEGVPDPDGR